MPTSRPSRREALLEAIEKAQDLLTRLQTEQRQAHAQLAALRSELGSLGREPEIRIQPQLQPSRPTPETPADKVSLFRQLFRGREDVFPTRFVSKKTGKPGYAPACSNKFVFHDAGANRFEVDLREAWVGYTAGPLDLRLGRQIVTWGVGDLVFVADVFPKDWESFFSGRPLEYLKLGVDGLRARASSQTLNGELLIVPFFTPDAFPPASRFFFFDPFASLPDQRELRPEPRYSNTELALRLYGRAAGFDVSGYAFRGFSRTPSARLESGADPATVVRFYPRLSAYAASAQRSILEGVVSLEAGYYDSREDRQGTDPSIPNSQWRFLAGYQREPRQDATVGVQGYAELMSRADAYLAALPAGSPSTDRVRWVLTARVMQLLGYQAWKLGLFAAWSPTDHDTLLQPEVSHRLSDELAVSLGANVFGGTSETTFFGQFENSDNVYISARFDF